MIHPAVRLPREKIHEFCARRHIRKLSFFGSILGPDFDAESDVDVLVEFEQGHTPGLAIVDIEEELSQLLGGRKVDLVNPKYLNPRIKARVLSSAEVIHAQG